MPTHPRPPCAAAHSQSCLDLGQSHQAVGLGGRSAQWAGRHRYTSYLAAPARRRSTPPRAPAARACGGDTMAWHGARVVAHGRSKVYKCALQGVRAPTTCTVSAHSGAHARRRTSARGPLRNPVSQLSCMNMVSPRQSGSRIFPIACIRPCSHQAIFICTGTWVLFQYM